MVEPRLILINIAAATLPLGAESAGLLHEGLFIEA